MPRSKTVQTESTPEPHPATAPEWEEALEQYHAKTRNILSKAPVLRLWTSKGPNPVGGKFLVDDSLEMIADKKKWKAKLDDVKKEDIYLSDNMIYAATHLLCPTERKNRFPNDLDTDGNIRTNRIPAGDPVVIEAHGRFFSPVYKGYYALIGRGLGEKYTWKVGTRHKMKHKGFTDRFGAGLMLYPGQDLPQGAWRRVMHYHDRPSHLPDTEGLIGYYKVEADERHYDSWLVGWDGLVITLPEDRLYRVTALRDIPGVVEKCSGRDDASKLIQGKGQAAVAIASPARKRKRKRSTSPVPQDPAPKKPTSPTKETEPTKPEPDSTLGKVEDPEPPSFDDILRNLRNWDPAKPSPIEDQLADIEDNMSTTDERLGELEVRIVHLASRFDEQESAVKEITQELVRRVISVEQRLAALRPDGSE